VVVKPRFNFAVPRASSKSDGEKVRPMPRRTVGHLNRRIIFETEEVLPTNEILQGKRIIGKYEHSYHATKGWRTRRVWR
jgi:hypothetical protein